MKQKSVLEPNDILLWRRARKLKQADLATMLDRGRETLVRWETGKASIPDWVAGRLEEIAFTLAPKAQPKLPDFVTPSSAPYLFKKHPTGWVRRAAHPGIVVVRQLLDPTAFSENVEYDSTGQWINIPFGILEREEYKLAAQRSIEIGPAGGE
jgi:hypothetical protein